MPKKLILVDDDQMEEFILRRYLDRSDVNLNLQVFLSGTDFLAHMKSVKSQQKPMPDIVLLDIRMPDASGFEVLSRLRGDEAFADLPTVIMFSNSRDETDVARALELGADRYQSKPDNPQDWTSFIQLLSA